MPCNQSSKLLNGITADGTTFKNKGSKWCFTERVYYLLKV